MTDPYIGKFLDDRYEILDVLGTGGMAVVYKARCHRLNRLVAVKILKQELSTDQELCRRFHDESQAVAMLSHPNIVSVYDVSQVDGTEFIVMELIDGITLKQYMKKRGGCLNWREALHFSTLILQGLRHAHSRGLIHRDIKPQNIMVLRDGSVKVADFGIARATNSQSTLTQEAIGSVHYISPEQARGGYIDARTDLYSAGVVLYEMLTGRLPYEGENPVNVALQHIKSSPVPPREINPEVPLGMEQITLKAMSASLDYRYLSADAFLTDLEDFRRNPSIDFGYAVPAVLTVAMEDEPTMIRRGEGFLGAEDDGGYDTPRRAAVPRFERDKQDDRWDDDYDNYYRRGELERERKKRTMIFVGIVAGAAVLLTVLIWLLVSLLGKEDPVYYVPDIVGLTIEQAENLIEEDETLNGHFTIRCESYEFDDEVAAGIILEQTPESEYTSYQETMEITVIVSSGPQEEEIVEVVLDDYTGMDYRLAKSRLEGQLLVCELAYEYHDTYEEGQVISTNPGFGATVKVGDTVIVTYSLGPKSETVPMVSLLNMYESDAIKNLETLGLSIGSVSTEYNDTYAEGRVCYQSIAATTVVELGTSVNITVSLGPEPVEEEEDPPETDPEEPDDGGTGGVVSDQRITVNLPAERTADSAVKIIVNGTILYENTVAATTASVTVDFTGTIAAISVTVDGADYQNYSISALS